MTGVLGSDCAPRADHSPRVECAWSHGGGNWWSAAVLSGEQRGLALRSVHLSTLHRGGREVPLLLRSPFLDGRHGVNATGAAVVAHPTHIDVVDDRLVVGIMNNRDVDSGNCSVVDEFATDPSSAEVAVAVVSEPVMHAPIESDVWPPVSGMPQVNTAHEAPVTRSP